MFDALIMLAQASGSGSAPATGQTSLLVWGIVLLAAAAALLFVELAIPSAGVISLAAAGCAVAGLVCLTFENTTLGLSATLAVLIACPFIVGFMIKVWPNTPIGKRLILKDGDEDQGNDDSDPTRSTRRQTKSHLPGVPTIGQQGVAKTPLRPVGTCVIDGRRIECLAVAGIIDAGSTVQVVDVDGMEVRVREVIPDV